MGKKDKYTEAWERALEKEAAIRGNEEGRKRKREERRRKADMNKGEKAAKYYLGDLLKNGNRIWKYNRLNFRPFGNSRSGSGEYCIVAMNRELPEKLRAEAYYDDGIFIVRIVEKRN